MSTTSSHGSGRLSIWDDSGTATTTPFSSPLSDVSRHSSRDAGSLVFSRPIVITFSKGTSLFRIPFARFDVHNDAGGGVSKVVMSSDTSMRENIFTLTFPDSRLPIPHLEQPYTTRATTSYRISFLEEQTLQTGSCLFQSKPIFAFERWDECLRFQEALLGQQVIFVAGMAEAKSRGRGEECISQNLRVIRPKGSTRATMIFFANSQRRERRKYVSVPLQSIENVDPGRRSSSAIIMRLKADTELMTSMRTLQVQFLGDQDHGRFLDVVRK